MATQPPRLLEGRIILVTGATGGLGSAIARACAWQGATVVLLSRTIPKLEALYDHILAEGGVQPALYPFDLSGACEKDYTELARRVKQELGGELHSVIHCAAELGHLGPIRDIETDSWDRLLRVNLTAPFLLTRELTSLLIASGSGSVVFIGDSAVGEGKAYWGAYGVAKQGLHAYAHILKNEMESFGLSVYWLVPGPIRTPLRRRAYPAENPNHLPSVDNQVEQILSWLSSTPSLNIPICCATSSPNKTG